MRPITDPAPGGLLDLVVPGECAGCAEPGPALCAVCSGRLGPAVEVRPGPPPVFALGGYAGALRSALLAYKERGRRELAAPFGAALAAGLSTLADRLAPPREWWLVPAPSRAAQARRRGGDHVVRLAEVAARELARAGRPAAVAPGLRLSRGVRDSVGLDAAARTANLAGRVRTRRRALPAPGTGVVLIDDVLTTGATAGACAAALRDAGVPTLAVIVLAAAGRGDWDCCRRRFASTFDGNQTREEGSGHDPRHRRLGAACRRCAAHFECRPDAREVVNWTSL